MKVRCRCGKMSEEDRSECYRCRISSVGFTFRAAGYGRAAFNSSTIAEKRADLLGDRVLGVDVEPSSTYGW